MNARALTSASLLALALTLAVALAGPAAAAFVHDPFVADLRLGAYREVGAVRVEAGWPAGLFAPLSLDPGWVAAAACLDSATAPGAAPGAEVIWPTLPSSAAAVAWYDVARGARDAVVAAAQGDTVVAARALDLPFAREILMLAASRAWERGRFAAAAGLAATLVERRAQFALDSESAFIWDLRARCLAERGGQAVRADGVWPRLADLGSYDVRSGWALWVACRRAALKPVLPRGLATRELGLALAAGGEVWLTAAQLRDAGFPADIEAALGALVLPSQDLAAHFARHAAPPADGLLQGYWLRGQRRRHALDGAWYEKLAATPGLKDGHRLDTWRGASEARVLAGTWEPALQDLEAGLRLMNGDVSKSMRRKLRDWTVKCLVLAVTEGRDDTARRVLASARRHLQGEDLEIFTREATPWLRRVDQAAVVPAPSSRYPRLQGEVVAGRAAAVPAGGAALPDPRVCRERAWLVWARLGAVLAGRPGEAASARALAYATALRATSAATDPADRQARACAAAGQFLAGTDAAETVRRGLLADAIVAAGHGAVSPEPTPLTDLVTAAVARGDNLLIHALLGVAIAAGDLRGQLAAMAVLPTTGLGEDDVLRLQYPLPTTAAIREAIAAAPVDADLILAVAKNESLFDPAVRSRAGALGFMQIMPFHYGPAARRPGRDHWSQPAVAIGKGAGLLADEARRFGGDPYRVVAAYNAGAGAAQRWDRQLGGHAGRAEFLAWIGYDETRRYVAAVLTDREVYRWLLGDAP